MREEEEEDGRVRGGREIRGVAVNIIDGLPSVLSQASHSTMGLGGKGWNKKDGRKGGR